MSLIHYHVQHTGDPVTSCQFFGNLVCLRNSATTLKLHQVNQLIKNFRSGPWQFSFPHSVPLLHLLFKFSQFPKHPPHRPPKSDVSLVGGKAIFVTVPFKILHFSPYINSRTNCHPVVFILSKWIAKQSCTPALPW